jgi:hypothetical protein
MCSNVRTGALRAEPDEKIRTAKQLFPKYKGNARRRNYSFELSYEQFYELIYSDCFYCGAPPSNLQGKNGGKPVGVNGQKIGTALYSGVDRKDNTKGYTVDNAVACCIQCNRAKSDYSWDEWTSWIDRLKTSRS